MCSMKYETNSLDAFGNIQRSHSNEISLGMAMIKNPSLSKLIWQDISIRVFDLLTCCEIDISI